MQFYLTDDRGRRFRIWTPGVEEAIDEAFKSLPTSGSGQATLARLEDDAGKVVAEWRRSESGWMPHGPRKT